MGKKNAVCAILMSVVLMACHTMKKPSGPHSETILVETQTAEQTISLPVYDNIQLKYGKILSVSPEVITNRKLYDFVDKWLNTPYKWGGEDERGIDCSAFLQRLLSEVYAIQVPRTSVAQFFARQIEPFASASYLSEGDLVFFRTLNNTLVSHVGIYLHNRMFVNSCSSKGVCIGSLDDPYWKRKYVAAGRIRRVKAAR